MSEFERDLLYQQYRNPGALASDEMSFVIDRMDRTNLFPSQEAMETAVDHYCAFLAGRMMAFYDRTGRTPSKVTINVDLEFES